MAKEKAKQVWKYHNPININNFTIFIDKNKPKIPEETRKRIEEDWKKFSEKIVKSGRKAYDTEIAYLLDYQFKEGVVNARVFLNNYSVSNWFNRRDLNEIDTRIGNNLGFNPFSSWMLPISSDGYALFSIKKDLGGFIDAFGGFTSSDDIVGNKIDTNSFVKRKLKQELGDLSMSVKNVFVNGFDYNPEVGIRRGTGKGFDCNYTAYLSERASQLKKDFIGNEQYTKILIPIPFDPQSLINFLENPRVFEASLRKRSKVSLATITGILIQIGANFGDSEYQKAIDIFENKGLVVDYSQKSYKDIRRAVLERTIN